jgi:hypothetical protein
MFRKLDESPEFQELLIDLVQCWLEDSSLDEDYDSAVIVQESLTDIADAIANNIGRRSMWE